VSNPAGTIRRKRGVRTLTLGVILLVSALGAAGGARADNPVLTGNVGANDAFTISLAGPTGAPVSNLDPGTYTLLVHDGSDLHNFHLTGPGVDVSTPVEQSGDYTIVVSDRSATDDFRLVGPGVSKATGVSFKGTVTWKLKLKAGRYTFRSDKHAALHGAFALSP
jgi:hypothetical protein